MGRHLERGWMFQRMERHQESLTEFGLARSEQGDRAEASAGMAFACLGLGNVGKAVTHSETALSEEPNSWLGHWALGRAFRLQRKLKKSETHVREALRVQPRQAALHAELSAIFLSANKLKEAEASARTGLECDPGSMACRHNLVLCLLARKQLEDASRIASEALTLHPDSADAHELAALALVEQENFSEAQRHALEALRLEPRNEGARELYVLTLKNSYPIYSAVVRFGMKVVRFFNNPAWFAMMGLFLPCLVGWVAIVALFRLVTGAISDIALAMKKETRRLLTPAERSAVPWLVFALVFFAVALAVGFSTNSESAVNAGMTAIALLLPARVVCKRLQLGIRGWYFYLTCLTAAFAAAILPASFFVPVGILHPLGFSTFLLSVVLALFTLSPRLLKVSKTTE